MDKTVGKKRHQGEAGRFGRHNRARPRDDLVDLERWLEQVAQGYGEVGDRLLGSPHPAPREPTRPPGRG